MTHISPAAVSDRPLRVAIVHYWLITMGGGEKVVQALLEMYPDADVYTLIADLKFAEKAFPGTRIFTSMLQRIPFASRMHRKLLPFMPAALENLDLSGYDLILSSESGPAKGILPPLGAVHVCYCHSPMRYLWDQYHNYLMSTGLIGRLVMRLTVVRLRLWDHVTAHRVDQFVANSSHIARRIAQYYRREAEVVHPPVNVDEFTLSSTNGDYYLITGRHVSYKRIDIAIEACRKLGRKLVITGSGPETDRLRNMADTSVTFAGQVSFKELKRYYAECRAFLMPGEEDFGIAPVEAMASGRPVIALARGGALDSVQDGVNGILYEGQSVKGLIDALLRFEAEEVRFNPAYIAATAQRFSRAKFKERMAATIARAQDRVRLAGEREPADMPVVPG